MHQLVKMGLVDPSKHINTTGFDSMMHFLLLITN